MKKKNKRIFEKLLLKELHKNKGKKFPVSSLQKKNFGINEKLWDEAEIFQGYYPKILMSRAAKLVRQNITPFIYENE